MLGWMLAQPELYLNDLWSEPKITFVVQMETPHLFIISGQCQNHYPVAPTKGRQSFKKLL